MILYYDGKKRKYGKYYYGTFEINTRNKISIFSTLLTYDEVIKFSPISTDFDEFTKYFIIVSVIYNTLNKYHVVELPENQKDLWNIMSIPKTSSNSFNFITQ